MKFISFSDEILNCFIYSLICEGVKYKFIFWQNEVIY